MAAFLGLIIFQKGTLRVSMMAKIFPATFVAVVPITLSLAVDLEAGLFKNNKGDVPW